MVRVATLRPDSPSSPSPRAPVSGGVLARVAVGLGVLALVALTIPRTAEAAGLPFSDLDHPPGPVYGPSDSVRIGV